MLGQAHTSRRRLLPAAAIALVVLVAPAVGVAGRATLHPHHARLHSLAGGHRAAVLGLYSLDRRVAVAHETLVGLERRQATLREEQESLRRGLVVAQRGLLVAQARVSRQLRSLYEAGTVSSVEVVLGARTLDDAMSNIEELDTTTAANRALVAELRGARGQLLRERRALAARVAALAAAHARAAATEPVLTRTRAARAAYVASLSREQRLSATRTVLSGTQLTVSTTAYSLPGHTSSGLHTGWGVVAVDPSVIPLGTHLTIPGYGEAVAADTGTAIVGNRVDLWFPTLTLARAWGRRTVTITLH